MARVLTWIEFAVVLQHHPSPTGCLAMAEDYTAQLRNLVASAEAATGKDAFDRASVGLISLGRRWPDSKLGEEASKAFDRLARHLPKFADAQQQDIVAAFRPLRDSARRLMAEAIAALENWLNEAPHAKKASPQRLAKLMQSMDEAPILRCYKQCTDLEVKTRFLWVAACTLRAVQDSRSPLHSHVGGHDAALTGIKRIAASFFTLPDHGCVLDDWHDGRLTLYDATLWRAGKNAANRFKDELQERLVAAMRGAPGATVSKTAKPQVQLALREWPMVDCPLVRALLDFVTRRRHELGDLGKPRLTECPPYSLRPSTLRRLLALLDAFEVVDGEGTTNGCPGVVRLKPEAAAALAFKAVGTKPKAAPTAPTAGGIATAASAAGGSSRPLASTAADGARKAVPATTAASAGGPGTATKLVRRKIDWKNSQALLRLVRRGLRAGDKEWAQTWQDYCKNARIAAESVQGDGPPKDRLEEFVEQNLATLMKKDWARDLMYKAEGQSDELPPEVEGHTGAESKELEAGASTPTQENRKEAAIAAIAGKRACRSGGSCSASDSSRARRHKRRRKEKRKMGMMAFGYDFGQGQTMTPEVLMMNQMMGMSMMMNSPLAMMGMGAPMMAHQMPMMQVGGSKLNKDENKSKRTRTDESGASAAAGQAGAAAASKPSDWGMRKENAIDADDL